MKKKLFSLLLALCMVLTLLPATASATAIVTSGQCGDDAEWTLYDDGKLVISGTGAMYDYSRGGTPWQSHYAAITRVEIQEGITTVGNNSFSFYDSRIAEVSFPNTLQSIGSSAFWDCRYLTKAVIPNSVTRIGSNAFYNCKTLKNVTISSTLETLGANAFALCYALETVTLPSTLTTIGEGAFEECTALKSIVIPDGVASLLRNTFTNCTSLQSVTLPAEMTYIGSDVFAKCTALKQITLPEKLTQLADNAFKYSGLTSIAIPDGVTTIQSRTFYECRSLAEVTLGNNTQRIHWEAFKGTAVHHVTFPATLTRIDQDAFYYSGIFSFRFLGDFPTLGSRALNYNPLVYYPCHNPTWTEQKMNSYKPSSSPTTTRYIPDHLSVNYRCTLCGQPYLNITGLSRVYGATRYETSFQTADLLKQRLAVDKFEAAIVTSGENFADALAGSYLAYLKGAPILLTNNRNINDVMDYVRENVVPGGTVYALGGSAVVTDDLLALEADGAFTVKRLAGATRFETNLEILKECGDLSGQDFLICTAYNFADSLSASAARRPILLVGEALTAEQQAFLSQQTDCNFYVIGGTGAVSTAIENKLAQYNRYGDVTRIAGSTRYNTSKNTAFWLFDEPLAAVFAYGQNFPDGLCAGPLAAALGIPLLLVSNDSTQITRPYVGDLEMHGGYVLGGPALISDATMREIFSWSESSPFNN